MKFLIGLLTLLLVVGCGGGGGGDPGGVITPPPEPDPTADVRTKAALEDCVPELMAELGDLSRILDAIFQGNGTTESVQLPSDGMGGFLVEGPPDFEFTRLQWEHMPGGPTAELAGTGETDFQDGAGSAFAAFDETQVDTLRSGGINALGALLLTLPNDSIVNSRYHGNVPESGIMIQQIAFQSGQATTSSGELDLQLEGCGGHLEFEDVLFSGLIAARATGTFGVRVNVDTDTIEGTLTGDGTSTVSLSVSLNGQPVTNWTLNLTSGVATKV